MREKCIEAEGLLVPGGQWEATAAGTKLDEQFEKYPKFEINKVATELLTASLQNTRNNRITVKFRPGDREASELANKLNGLFHSADYEEN